MSRDDAFVIVGAGLAGATAAQTLREQGLHSPVVLLGDEGDPPYERPPLSKDYLMGVTDREATFVHPRHWYADHGIELRTGVAVTAIDLARHAVTLADGTRLGYAKLLLTTGSSPRRLDLPGGELGRLYYLRRLGDSDRIRSMLRTASRVAIIGGGWIGLETAAAARAAGVQVTILEQGELPLHRVLGIQVARIYAELHRRHGVHLRCGARIAEITGDNDQATGVRLSDGTHFAADAVIIGAGILPNSRLAERAGLKTDNGIRVDQHLRTSDEDVYAAGDVANAYHPLLGRQLRVEHWANALHQPAVAARSMLGQDASYDRLPYFFSDQYELAMEYTGYAEPHGYDRVVVRGHVDDGHFVAFWLSAGRVLAGMNVNTWDVSDTIAALIRSGAAIDPDRLADPRTPLEALIES
jgi:3-phenylpropionate/trans-cinnamate dioxygenase ferredoxin reductase subunit